jgi:hypothetical protein
MSAPHAAGPAPPATVNNSDVALANAIADEIQRQIDEAKAKGVAIMPKTIFFSAAMGGIQNERVRVIEALDKIGQRAAQAMHHAAGLETAARMAGNHAAGDAAGADKQFHMIGARTILALIAEIQRDPTACRACGGTKFVESKLAPGEKASCDACAPVTEPSR